MRIAVAYHADGQRVQHFGKAVRFAIYEARGDAWPLIETRVTTAACGAADHQGALQANARLLDDCAAVIVSAIGPAAQDVLMTQGIYDYAAPGITVAELPQTFAHIRAQLARFPHLNIKAHP